MSENWQYKGSHSFPGHRISSGRLANRNKAVATENSSNARLTNYKNESIELWVNSFKMDLSVNGSTAQSRDYREFAPKAMGDIIISVTGQVASDKEYNRLAEFIRSTQRSAISSTGAGQSRTRPVVKFSMPSTVKYKKDPKTGRLVTDAKGKPIPEGRSKTHGYAGWLVHGYIKNIRAGAARFNHAPSWAFDFVMSYSDQDKNAGLNQIFVDQISTRAAETLNWMNLVVEEGYGYKPNDKKENVAQTFGKQIPIDSKKYPNDDDTQEGDEVATVESTVNDVIASTISNLFR